MQLQLCNLNVDNNAICLVRLNLLFIWDGNLINGIKLIFKYVTPNDITSIHQTDLQKLFQ